MLASVTTDQNAPVIAAQRLRKGSTGSPRGAARIVADALKTVRQLCAAGEGRAVLLQADSTFYGRPTIAAALRAGVDVSVTVRLTTNVKAAIASIEADARSAMCARPRVTVSRGDPCQPHQRHHSSGSATRQARTARSRSRHCPTTSSQAHPAGRMCSGQGERR